MNKRPGCRTIMLIDDNPDDNFFHEREIKKTHLIETVIIMNSGFKALDYLKSNSLPHPNLIFLDINMPGMNGWEFLEEYNAMDKELQSKAIVVMLTTSDNSRDQAKALSIVHDFKTKPLTKTILEDVINNYFPLP